MVSLSSSSPDEETEDDVDGTDEAKSDRKDHKLPEHPLFVPYMTSTCRSQLAHAHSSTTSGDKASPVKRFQRDKTKHRGSMSLGHALAPALRQLKLNNNNNMEKRRILKTDFFEYN